MIATAASPVKTPQQSTAHLVVLQHGLWGTARDVERLTQHLQTAFEEQHAKEIKQDSVLVVNSTCNERALTYDGVDVCGARLANYIQDQVQHLQADQGVQVIKLSLIGYSLGGLIVRYAAGKLYVSGFFEKVQPVNLITIATPHLGSFKAPTSWLARFFNSQVPIVASRTGMQLLLADADYSVPWLAQQQALHNQARQEHEQGHGHHQQEQEQQQEQQNEEHMQGNSSSQQQHQHQEETGAAVPQPTSSNSSSRRQQQRIALPPGVDPREPVPLLLLMAHPAGPFHKALAGFRTRICAANIKYDTTVPYCTAAMCISNPYEDHPPVSIDPATHPSVVRPATVDEQVQPPTAKGRGRLLMFLLFMPLFPVFWAISVTKGLLHHRKAKRRPLDADWLQHYSDALAHGLNPFSRQASQQLQLQQHQQPPQQQRVTAANSGQVAGAGLPDSSAAAGAAPAMHLIASVAERSPFAASATAGGVGGYAGVSTAAALADADEETADGDAFTEVPAAAGQLQTEAEVLQASGGAVVLTPQASRRLTHLTSSLVPEHEGIVEAVGQETWLLQQQQHWMAKQLFDNMPLCVVAERRWSSSGSSSAVLGSSKQSVSNGEAAVDVELRASTSGDGGAASEGPVVEQPEEEGAGSRRVGSVSKQGSSSSTVSLSGGGWHRVDVWTGHMHAHATIVIRDRRYESQSRDLFEYLVNHISL